MSRDGRNADVDVDYESKNPFIVASLCALNIVLRKTLTFGQSYILINTTNDLDKVRPDRLSGNIRRSRQNNLGGIILMLRPLILISFLLVGSSPTVRGQVPDTNEDLAVSARGFLTSWLLRRNGSEALKYLAKNPILGSCMTPQSLEGKRRPSRSDISNVLRLAMSSSLTRTVEAQTLDDLLDSNPIIPSNDVNVTFVSHSMPKYFQIFRLKSGTNPSNIAYICKFDERPSFREAVARPNVYYVFTKVRGKTSFPSLAVGLLWVKEKGRWRILTMSIAEGQ